MIARAKTGPKGSDKLRRLRNAASGDWVDESVPDIDDLRTWFDANVVPDEFKHWLGRRLGEYRIHVFETNQELTRREVIDHLKSLSSNIQATRRGLTHIPPHTLALLATSLLKQGHKDFEVFDRVAKELIDVLYHVEIVLNKFHEEHDSAGRGDFVERNRLIYNVIEKLRPAFVSKIEVARGITHEILRRAGVEVPAIGSMKASAQKGKEIHLQKG